MKKLIILFLILVIGFIYFQCNSEKAAKSTHALNWSEDAVIYELFVRDFTPEGTFRAAMKKIPYLKQTGVDIVWLMPIYPIGQKGRKGSLGSPFSVRNYYEVNPEFGSKEDFKALVDAVHAAGMKIIIGFVPNHSANDYVEMPHHPDWFMKDDSGNFTREVADWSDITDFNYDNPQLRDHIKDILAYWIKEFNVDGFRNDVAGMVPDSFWIDAVAMMRKIKPDIFLLAEWEDKKFIDFGFNSDYSWKTYHILKDIYHGKSNVGRLVKAYEEKLDKYGHSAPFMNFIENHDEPRAVLTFSNQHIKPFATFIFTVPGRPLLFMGQEFGDTVYSSWRSLFEKEPIDWSNFDSSLYHIYSTIANLRNEIPISRSKWTPILVDSLNNTLVYSSMADDKGLLTFLNFSSRETTISIDTPPDFSTFLGRKGIEIFSSKPIPIGKKITVELKPFDAAVILLKK
ncbi:MAG: alpha-amylase family glycosyl hydrolase [Calditrichia bacterium]